MIRHHAALMGAVLMLGASLGSSSGAPYRGEALDLDALTSHPASFTMPPPQSWAAASGPGYGWDMARIAQARRRGRKLQRKQRGQR